MSHRLAPPPRMGKFITKSNFLLAKNSAREFISLVASAVVSNVH